MSNNLPIKNTINDNTLDDTDYQILRLLQKNGRYTNTELAEIVNVSPATCHRRVQKLFQDKYILSINARIDPQKVNREALVLVGVILDSATTESFNNFEQAIQKLPMIIDCYLVSGDYDFFLKIRAKDINDYNQLHIEHLLKLPNIRQLRTFFSMKQLLDNNLLDF